MSEGKQRLKDAVLELWDTYLDASEEEWQKICDVIDPVCDYCEGRIK